MFLRSAKKLCGEAPKMTGRWKHANSEPPLTVSVSASGAKGTGDLLCERDSGLRVCMCVSGGRVGVWVGGGRGCINNDCHCLPIALVH